MNFRPHWSMDPSHHFSRQFAMRRWHRGPSRLLWFFLGAGATAWWMKHKECREYQVRNCMRSRIPPEAYPPPAQGQGQSQPQGLSPGQAQGPEDWHWHARKWEWSWPPKENQQGGPSAILPGMAPGPDGWEDETQRLQKMTQQATETLAGISEAGLDSLLSTVESLKAKIVERREQREREQAELQAHREERFKQFEEWRRQQEEADKKPRLV